MAYLMRFSQVPPPDGFAKRVVADAQPFGHLAAGMAQVQTPLGLARDLSGHDRGPAGSGEVDRSP